MSCGYINNFKGRTNRKEAAKHIRDEFYAIEDAFTGLVSNIAGGFTSAYTNTASSSEIVEIDPANGRIQELTVTGYTVISVKPPTENDTKQFDLLIHGSLCQIINGWGPQTWKERGPNDWTSTFTGQGPYASMMIKFIWDGYAWIGIVLSKAKNPSGAETFDFINDLVSTSGNETLVYTRAGAAVSFDTNEKALIVPTDVPRYVGSRYVRNWVATPSDLQSAAWEETNAVVSTEAGGGPTGGDVDKITFSATGGEVGCWFVPEFGRPWTTSGPVKFKIRFKAKIATGTSGSFRAVLAYKGAYSGQTIACHESITVNIDDEWRDYGHCFDIITDRDPDTYVLHPSFAERATLTKFSIMSPSGSTGSPVLIEGVQIEPVLSVDSEIPSELQEGSIGSTLTLAKTAASTGTWDNGTKSMTLGAGEFVDFQDSLEVGNMYLMVARLTSGTQASFLLGDDRIYWAPSSPSQPKYVQDAPFTFFYEGGVVKWKAGASGAYTVNIYKCTGNYNVYETEIGNSLNLLTYVLTSGTGVPVSTAFAAGLALEATAATNLLDYDEYRSFYNWTKVGLYSGFDDSVGQATSFRSEYGIDGLPSKATLLQDRMTANVGYVTITKTIPADTNDYTFSLFIRRVFDLDGNKIVLPEYGVNALGSPSEYVDVSLQLSDGAGGTKGGQRVRVRVKDSVITLEPSVEYSNYLNVNYQQWWRVGMSLTNDGTFTQAIIKIYPAPDDGPDASITDPTLTGWAIVDWGQLELDDGSSVASSPIVGGETRGAGALATALADGYLYDKNLVQVGTVASTVFGFTLSDEIWKNILWSPTLIEHNVIDMHEFGPPDEACTEYLLDQSGDAVLDQAGEEICAGPVPPAPADPAFKFQLTMDDDLGDFVMPTPQYLWDDVTPAVYDYYVDWGDGSAVEHVTDWDTTHSYWGYTGTVTISITGRMDVWRWDYTPSTDHDFVSAFLNWGDVEIKEFISMFSGLEYMAYHATDAPDLGTETEIYDMFWNAGSELGDVSTGDWSGWDVSLITDFDSMFQKSSYNPNCGGWDVSNGYYFIEMFNNCPYFNADLSAWDVSGGYTFSGMFSGSVLFDADLSAWDVSNGRYFNAMFMLTQVNFDFSGWDVSNGIDGFYKFLQVTTMSVANYDALLNAWSALTFANNGHKFWCTQNYTIATSQAARDVLTGAPNNWIITDSGGI